MLCYLLAGLAVYIMAVAVNVVWLKTSTFRKATPKAVAKGLVFGIVLWPASLLLFIRTHVRHARRRNRT
jgi:hypothetical protein